MAILDYDAEGLKDRVIEVLEDETVRYWVDQLDVSRSVISHKWLKRTTLPKSEILLNILKVKGLSANWLFFGVEPKKLSDVSEGQSSWKNQSASERFLKLFPNEVQDYIVQTVRLLPDSSDDHSLPLLVNTLNVLIAYLQREKEQLSASPSKEDLNASDAEFEVRIDAEGNLVYCNPGMLSAFALQSGKIYGLAYSLPVDPKDAERFKTTIAELSPEKPKVRVRVRLEIPTGVSEWQEWIFEAKFDGSGNRREMIGRGNVVPPNRIRHR